MTVGSAYHTTDEEAEIIHQENMATEHAAHTRALHWAAHHHGRRVPVITPTPAGFSVTGLRCRDRADQHAPPPGWRYDTLAAHLVPVEGHEIEHSLPPLQWHRLPLPGMPSYLMTPPDPATGRRRVLAPTFHAFSEDLWVTFPATTVFAQGREIDVTIWQPASPTDFWVARQRQPNSKLVLCG